MIFTIGLATVLNSAFIIHVALEQYCITLDTAFCWWVEIANPTLTVTSSLKLQNME